MRRRSRARADSFLVPLQLNFLHRSSARACLILSWAHSIGRSVPIALQNKNSLQHLYVLVVNGRTSRETSLISSLSSFVQAHADGSRRSCLLHALDSALLQAIASPDGLRGVFDIAYPARFVRPFPLLLSRVPFADAGFPSLRSHRLFLIGSYMHWEEYGMWVWPSFLICSYSFFVPLPIRRRCDSLVCFFQGVLTVSFDLGKPSSSTIFGSPSRQRLELSRGPLSSSESLRTHSRVWSIRRLTDASFFVSLSDLFTEVLFESPFLDRCLGLPVSTLISVSARSRSNPSSSSSRY